MLSSKPKENTNHQEIPQVHYCTRYTCGLNPPPLNVHYVVDERPLHLYVSANSKEQLDAALAKINEIIQHENQRHQQRQQQHRGGGGGGGYGGAVCTAKVMVGMEVSVFTARAPRVCSVLRSLRWSGLRRSLWSSWTYFGPQWAISELHHHYHTSQVATSRNWIWQHGRIFATRYFVQAPTVPACSAQRHNE